MGGVLKPGDPARTHVRGVRSTGQAMVEYIVLIGLIVLFLLVVLIQFRNSISAFTQSVVSYFESASGPPVQVALANPPPPRPAAPPRAAPSAPPKVAPPASPRPTPSATPAPESPSGKYCAPFNDVEFREVGPGLITTQIIRKDGTREPAQTFRVTTYPGGFRITSVSNPQFFVDHEFIDSGGSFRITGGSNRGPGAPGDNFRPC